MRLHSPHILVVAVLISSHALAPRAGGADRFWIGGLGGQFSSPANWLEGDVPNASDSAIFDLGAIYSVTFNSSHTTDRLLVRSGQVTMQLNAWQYTLDNPISNTPSVAVGVFDGDTARLTVAGGTLHATFTDVGLEAGAFGMLVLNGPSSMLENDQQIRIGNQGGGTMQIVNGAHAMNGTSSVALATGSYGEVEVGDANSLWTCNGDLAVGKGGAGSLTIDQGADVVCHDAIIGQQLSAFGDVRVAGAGSSWTVNGTLDVGMTGFGTLLIEDGATVSNHTFAILGTYPGGDIFGIPGKGGVGHATVRGAGSLWTIAGDLYVGRYLTRGHLRLADGGKVVVADDLALGTTRSITFELHGADDYPTAALSVTDTLQAGVGYRVELDSAYAPQVGDTFALIQAGAISAAITLSLPPLPMGMQWQVNQTSTQLALTILCAAPADITGDGNIDVNDLLAVVGAWGACPGPCPSTPCPADVNDDCLVNVNDLLAVVGAWGGGCP